MRIRTALLAAGALGVLATTSAVAQDYYDNGAGEQVIVVAPDYYYHRPYPSNQLGRPPEPTTLSRSVSYSDLNLTTYEGAETLRVRIRDTARDICATLAARYPVRMVDSEPCYKNAVGIAMNRADLAIHPIRYYGGYTPQ